jgi:tetratricopeptide (TPR) repeat protein
MPHRARRTTHGIQRSAQWEQRTPRRIGRESRATPAALPVPRPWRTLLVQLVATLALLVGLARVGQVTGTAAGTWLGTGSWRGDTWHWLTAPVDGLAAVLPGEPSAGARDRIGIAALALLCFAAWRTHRRARLAYCPGPVDVHEFTDATADQSAPVADLKSQFCQRLSETHIYPPYAGPADPPPVSFLDVAGGVDSRTTSPAAMLLQMLPRLWPKIGYRVTGVLQQREREPRFGVSVTVTSFLGGGRSAMTTQWGRTWAEATGLSAYWVLATILPVTRLAKAPPWRGWRARELPPDLFAAYNRGKELQDDRNLDEALWYYSEALKLDPFNADLRMMVASAQQEMGLFLDALDTYQAALVLREQGGWYDDHIWTTRCERLRAFPRHLLGTLLYLYRRPESIRLRYQYACTLAYTERTVHQWFKRGVTGEREKVRRQVRHRLEKTFVDRYWPTVAAFADSDGEQAAKDWLRRALRESPEATAVVFQLAAAHEIYRLREDALLARLVRFRRSEVTHTALRLLRDVSAPLRIARAWSDWRLVGWYPVSPHRLISVNGGPPEPVAPFSPGGALTGWWRAGPRRRAAQLLPEWPAGGALLDRAIRQAQGRRGLRPPLRSFDFYNAACVYGFALKGYFPDQRSVPRRTRPGAGGPVIGPGRPVTVRFGSPDGQRHGSPDGRAGAARPASPQVALLVDKALERLRASLACTDSGVAADRLRRWILSSEPDLAPLRRLREFGHFEEEVYPNLALVLPRPDKVINSRMSAYAMQLVCHGAAVLEEAWRERALADTPVELHQLIRWLDLDASTWETLGRIARDRARYWRDRAEFIRLLREAVDPIRLAEARFPPVIPRFDDVKLKGADRLVGDGRVPGESIERLARINIALVDSKLGSIHRTIAEHAGDGSLRAKQRLAGMNFRGEPLRGDDARELCVWQAGRWQRVAERMREAGLAVETSNLPGVVFRH